MPEKKREEVTAGLSDRTLVGEYPFPRRRLIVFFKSMGDGSSSITLFARRPRETDDGGRAAKGLLDQIWKVLERTEHPFDLRGTIVHRPIGRLLKEAVSRTYELGATGDSDLEAFLDWTKANREMQSKLMLPPAWTDDNHPPYLRWLQQSRKDLYTLLLVAMHERVEDSTQPRSARLAAAVAAGLLSFFEAPVARGSSTIVLQIVESVAAHPILGDRIRTLLLGIVEGDLNVNTSRDEHRVIRLARACLGYAFDVAARAQESHRRRRVKIEITSQSANRKKTQRIVLVNGKRIALSQSQVDVIADIWHAAQDGHQADAAPADSRRRKTWLTRLGELRRVDKSLPDDVRRVLGELGVSLIHPRMNQFNDAELNVRVVIP